MVKHSGSDSFQTGLPGICDKCFKEQKPSERHYFHTTNDWRYSVRGVGRR